MASPSLSTPAGWTPPSQDEETRTRARQLASILTIPPNSFDGRDRAALEIMSHLGAMPVIKDFAQRHQYGNEVLQNTNKAFPYDLPDTGIFYAKIQGLVITMQEFPVWYHNLTASNTDLVENYLVVSLLLKGMSIAGLTGLAGVGASFAGKIVQSVPGTIEKSGMSGAALVRGGAAAVGKTVRGGLAGAGATGFVAVWLVGQAAATILQTEQSEMKKEIIRRYQENRLPVELYRRALGDDLPPPQRYFYPVS